MVVVGVGLWISRSEELVSFQLPGLFEGLHNYVRTYREVAVGGGFLLLGALIAAFAAFELLPDQLSGRSLAFVRPWNGRQSRLALFAGLTCYATVVGLVLLKWTSPLVFCLFLTSIVLISLAIFRADNGPPSPDLGFRKVDAVILPVLAFFFVSLNLVELTHWRFSCIGDEGAFFNLAKYLSRGGGYSLFDLAGVYGTHPVLDSAYQAWFLRIFGADIVGWRLAEIFGLAASALLLYALVLLLFGRVPAIVAAIILGTNHHLMAFARIGYNNLHCIFYALLVMLFLVLAWRTGRAHFVFMTGSAMGLCIYSFSVGLLVWPLVALLVAIKYLCRPTIRELAAVGLMIAGFLLAITPGLLTTPPDHLFDQAVKHSKLEANAQDLEANAEYPMLVARTSLVQSFLVFWVNPQWVKHYVGGPLLDAVTSVLFFIGGAVGLVQIRNGSARIALIWFVMGLVIIALASYVPQPFFTRLLFLTPACAILAAMGVFCLDGALRGLRLPAWLATGVILGLTAAIPALNLHQLLVKSPRVVGINSQIITMKALQENPGHVIVEVGTDSDRNRFQTVSFYPRLREYYTFSRIDDLEPPPAPMGPDDKMPIYLLHEGSLFPQLREKLPPTYVVQTDAGRNRHPEVWLFKPTKRAPKPRAATVEIARLSNPKIVLEVQLQPVRGARRARPQDVAVGPDGSFFVACSGDNTIRKYSPAGKPQKMWGNTDPARPVFDELFAIAAHPDGTLYALDAGVGAVRHFSQAGETLSAPIQGVGYFPRGLSIGPDGELLVADTGGGEVLRLDQSGERLDVIEAPVLGLERLGEPVDVAVVGGESLLVFYARDFVLANLGRGDFLEMSWPISGKRPASESGHFAINADGWIFLCNASEGQVVIYDSTGNRLAIWRQKSGDTPVGISVDQNDGVYVTYPEQDLVRKYQLGHRVAD
jgi:streptogramin lyase/4-amino-4-deoxy-L-arabinose transferase-like glycosyltransferase